MKRVFSIVGLTVVLLSYFASGVFAADGWASMNGDTTGGAGGTIVTVDNATDLEYYAEVSTAPYIIRVSGIIDIGSSVEIRSNKTLIGLDSNSTLIGQIGFKNRDSNIIIERLNITNPYDYGDGDGIRLTQDINNVFITKCTFYDCADGCLDISNRSDFVTISWCKFYYVSQPSHRYANLIGSSDDQEEDRGKLRTTIHHNWWSSLCYSRMPRVRFGQVHVYNNYYDCPGNDYCIGVGVEAHIRVENNYFNNVEDAWEDYGKIGYTDGEIGWNTGNVFYSTSIPTWATNKYSTIFTPPYPYTMDDGADVPALVQSYAGAGNPYPPHWLVTLYGDFDINGVVNENDLETFADYWLQTSDIDDANYFDDNDRVDGREFALFAQNWRKTF